MDAVAGSLLSGRTRLLAGASIAPCPSSLTSSHSSAPVRWVSTSSSSAAANASSGAVSSSNAAVRRRRSFLCPLSVQELQLKQNRRFRGGLRSAAADGAVVLEVSAADEKTEEAAVEAVPIEKRYPAFPTVLDINAIRDILPHRFPFLLVDRVIEYNPGVSAVGIKNVTINDNFFPGHFPERPIMPGVLMVEAMAQVGGIMMLSPDMGGSKESFFFAGVDKVRFRKPVIAGDTLVMRMNLVKLQKRFGIAKLEGKAYVGGEVVCEGEFLLAMGSSDV